MRVFRFVAGGLLAVAALVGGAATASATSPACSDWPSGATCAVPDNNEWPLASANDAKGEF